MAYTHSEPPQWDLSEYYDGLGDPRIMQDLADDLAGAIAFEKKYKGRIASLGADALGAAVQEYESLSSSHGRERQPGKYVHLSKMLDMNSEEVSRLQSSISKANNEYGQHLLFWFLELSALDGQALQDMYRESETLAHYRPYLSKMIKMQPHTLSDEVESALQVRERADISGAMSRLYNAQQAAMRFEMPNGLVSQALHEKCKVRGDTEGVLCKLTASEIYSLRNSKDEAVRASAYRSVEKAFQELAKQPSSPAFTMNYALDAKAIGDKERGFKHPADRNFLKNDVEAKVVNTLVEAVRESYEDIPQRFYRSKATLLGKQTLSVYDDFVSAAPAVDEDGITWEEAKELVLNAFEEFSPRMKDIASMFFDNGWIDAKPALGKRAVAFSSANVSSSHPHVFMNFTGKKTDAVTLAHELGHGIHQYLAAQKQGDLMDRTSTPFAETASTFAEMLVFKKLLGRSKNDSERVGLLAEKIDRGVMINHRQIAYHLFEEWMHEERKNGEISSDTYAEKWKELHEERMGDTFSDKQDFSGHTWGGIPHFYMPFYVYSYAFGDLLANGLYKQYETMKADGKGEEFVEKYIDMLASASTEHHSTMLAERFGESFDLSKKAFWEGGLSIYSGLQDELENLIAKGYGAPTAAIDERQGDGRVEKTPRIGIADD